MEATVSFDILFIDVMNPRSTPVKNKMIARGDFVSKNIEATQPSELLLHVIRDEMQRENRLRLPLLDSDGRIRYIVHKSLIDDFLLDALPRLEELQVAKHTDLSLAHLLADPRAGRIASETFAVVPASATAAEAQAAMNSVQGCRDVFVTDNGRPDSPVLGWITNIGLGL
jgi:hypothetical protein